MSDQTPPKPPTKVTITTSGVSVTIEAVGQRQAIQREAQELHREAYQRCVAIPDGHGGAL